MKRNRIGILMSIIGIIVVIYPIVSNIIASNSRSMAILSYQEQMKELTDDQIEKEKEKVREYNKSLETDTVVKNSDEETQGINYLNVLDVGEVIGYVKIPKIDVNLPIYHNVNENVLQSGVGHVENTSFPIGEKGTHAIFAGHTGLVRTKIFDDLDKLVIGDKFYINMLNQELAFEVDQIKVVDPESTKYTGIDKNQEYVTLLTCTPYAINSHRLLVRGVRVEEQVVDVIDNVQVATENDKSIRYDIIYIFAIIILLIVHIIMLRKMNKNIKLKIVGIFIIVIGISILISPSILKNFTQKKITEKIDIFNKETEIVKVDEKSMLDLLHEEFEKYNQNLYQEGLKIVDAFSYENNSFDLSKYGFSENIVGNIEIQKMNVKLPLYLGSTKENLRKGATILGQTSMPIGGENTNSVIAAHRGLVSNDMFRNIHKLRHGDKITITNMWGRLEYKVCEIKIISPDDIDQISIQEGRDMITLITCHPYRINNQRYVVYAERDM